MAIVTLRRRSDSPCDHPLDAWDAAEDRCLYCGFRGEPRERRDGERAVSLHSQSGSGVMKREVEERIRVWERRFWWSGQWLDEPVGTFDGYTTLRSRTREGVIEKWRKRLDHRPYPSEEIVTITVSQSSAEPVSSENFGEAMHPTPDREKPCKSTKSQKAV